MKLSQLEVARYDRHLKLKEFGLEGQIALKKAKVLLVGLGGTGCPVALYLTAMGVGHLGLMDPDQVGLPDLQRQILFTEKDVGQLKVYAAAQALSAHNSLVALKTFPVSLSPENLDFLNHYDLIIEGSDQVSLRYLINAGCRARGKPYLFAGVQDWKGLCALFLPDRGPCFRCLFPNPASQRESDPAATGDLGAFHGILGLGQAVQAVRYFLGERKELEGTVISHDFRTLGQENLILEPSPDCPLCSERAQQEQGRKPVSTEVSPQELRKWLENQDPVWVIDVREAWEQAGGMIHPSQNIPLKNLADHLNSIPKERKVVTCCEKGQRAQIAVRILKQAGYDNCFSLQGGIEAWLKP